MQSFSKNEYKLAALQSNSDCALWYGWGEMRQDLAEITRAAEELRQKKGSLKFDNKL